MSGGFGYGAGGGVEVAWAPGVPLSHQREASISATGEYADVIGGRVTQNLLHYSPDQGEVLPNGLPTGAIVFGLGGGAGVQEELSTPIPHLIWGQPSVQSSLPQTYMSQPNYYQSYQTSVSTPQLSSAQSSALSGILSSFRAQNATQQKAVQQVISAFGG